MAKKKHEEEQKRSILTVEQRKNILKREYLLFGVIINVVVAFIVLNASAYMCDHKDTSIFEALGGGINEFFHNPLYFFIPNPPPANKFLPGLLFSMVMASAIMLFAYEKARQKVRDDPYSLYGNQHLTPAAEVTEYCDGMTPNKKFKPDSGIYLYGKGLSANRAVEGKFIRVMNMLIMAMAGSGKSYSIIKPNLLQSNGCSICTDPSGELKDGTAEMKYREGDDIKVLDLMNMSASDGYNPFIYCKNVTDISNIIDIFINLAGKTEENKGGNQDPFWEVSGGNLLKACATLLFDYGDDPEIMDGRRYKLCFGSASYLAARSCHPLDPKYGKDGAEQDDDYLAFCKGSVNEQKGSALGHIFNNIRKKMKREGIIKEPYCLTMWEKFKTSGDKTASSTLATLTAKLAPFDDPAFQKLTSTDTMDLNNFGTCHRTMYLVTPVSEDAQSYMFLVAMLYTQVIAILLKRENDLNGSHTIKTSTGDFIRWYPSGVPIEDVEKDMNRMKNCSILPMHAKDNPDDKYYAIVDNEYDPDYVNNIVGRNEREVYDKFIRYVESHTVTRRIEKQDALDFASAMKNPKIHTTARTNRNPLPVNLFLDEFYSIGKIPGFQKLISNNRKYNIIVCIIIQSKSQLEEMYEKSWPNIAQNCEAKIFLGGNDPDTCEWFSKLFGKTTRYQRSESIDAKGGTSVTTTPVNGDLIPPDELMGLRSQDHEAVVKLGAWNVRCPSYDYHEHPMYKYTHDYMDEIGKGADYCVFETDRLPYLPEPEWMVEAEFKSDKHLIEIGVVDENVMKKCLGVFDDELYDAMEESARTGMSRIPGKIGFATT